MVPFADGNFHLSLKQRNDRNYSFDDNNAFKENDFKDSMMINKRVVTHEKSSGIFSSTKLVFLSLLDFSENLVHTQLHIQLNFVGFLNNAERRFI